VLKTEVIAELSEREMEMAGLEASGLSIYEIGHRLSLSHSTIKKYLVRVYEKLGISTRLELILYVLSYYKSSESEENENEEDGLTMGA
jgi:DNA-binding NarL/FixJ family response regulator